MINADSLEILGLPKWLLPSEQAVEAPISNKVSTPITQQKKTIKCLVVEKKNNNSFLAEGATKELLFKMLTAINLKQEDIFCLAVTDEQELQQQKENFIAQNVLLMGDFQAGANNTFITHHPSEILAKPELKRIVWETLKKVNK
jgi:DNA polymerase III psi subunit